MEHRQSPLLSVVAPPPLAAPSMWRQEAEGMHAAGLAIRGIALTLPADSLVRDEMLSTASEYLLHARLRGVDDPPRAALTQSR